MTTTCINLEKYYSKFGVRSIDLTKNNLFTEEDYKQLREVFGYLTGQKRILNILCNLPNILRNIPSIIKDINQIVSNQLKDLKKFSKDNVTPLKDRYPISDYINKASIIAAFSPKNILEIGTYYGWGATSIKVACPKATVYTMNPTNNEDANNPIDNDMIGSICKKKGVKVIQIWADSTKFDYNTLPKMDVSYVDGNHEYAYVYKDLESVSKITHKIILVDDYIPNKNSPRGGVRAWGPWNESVVKAVNDFISNYSNIIQNAYWIENTPICVIHLKPKVK